MTDLVKFYNPTTCYDGAREFSLPINKAGGIRYYPDEYLIVTILDKYLAKRAPGGTVVILAEDWSSTPLSRNGDKNSIAFNTQIINKIIELDKHPQNILLLVPFLLGYHHPGIAVDVKNKTVIYIDPFGIKTGSLYKEVDDLKAKVEQIDFNFKIVNTRQQKIGDGTSCGPILTQSMIKFVEEFLNKGCITIDNFEGPRQNLATDRLYQMYVNNLMKPKAITFEFQEIMLADSELLRMFFKEQKFNYRQNELLAVMYYFQFSVSKGDVSKIHQMMLIQSRLTELLFLQPENVHAEIDALLLLSTHPVSQGIPDEVVYRVLRLEKIIAAKKSIQPEHILPPPCSLPEAKVLVPLEQVSSSPSRSYITDLDARLKQFNDLCATLKSTLSGTALEIINRLEGDIVTNFQEIESDVAAIKEPHPSKNVIDDMIVSKCKPSITHAKKDLTSLYGFWDRIPVDVRRFLGLVSAILFPIAIVVHYATERGYYATFFEKSFFTNAVEQLDESLNYPLLGN